MSKKHYILSCSSSFNSYEPAPAPYEPVPAPYEPVPASYEPVPASYEPVPTPYEPVPYQPVPAPEISLFHHSTCIHTNRIENRFFLSTATSVNKKKTEIYI